MKHEIKKYYVPSLSFFKLQSIENDFTMSELSDVKIFLKFASFILIVLSYCWEHIIL